MEKLSVHIYALTSSFEDLVIVQIDLVIGADVS